MAGPTEPAQTCKVIILLTCCARGTGVALKVLYPL